MTIADFINKYNGRRVADGQCGNLVRAYWNEIDHTVPPSYVNSKDYWFNPVPGYDKVSSPQPGDIAIYNGHGAYPEGHSAIYVGDGKVFEQNADPDGSPAHIFARNSPYLLGYLRKQGKGEDMPDINTGDFKNIADDFGTGDVGAFNGAKDWNGEYYGAIRPRIRELRASLESATGIANIRGDRLEQIAKLVGAKNGDDFDTLISKIKTGGDYKPYNGEQLYTKEM